MHKNDSNVYASTVGSPPPGRPRTAPMAIVPENATALVGPGVDIKVVSHAALLTFYGESLLKIIESAA